MIKLFRSGVVRAASAAVIALAVAAPVSAETLADAMASAYKHSGLLEQNRALLRAADDDVAVAVAGLRPVVSWASQVQRTFGKRRTTAGGAVFDIASTDATISLSAQLMLYDGGSTRLSIDAAKETVLGTRQALISVEQEVLLRAVEAFMEVRRATENVALNQSNVRLITEELRAARDRFDVGEVTRTDVALTEAALASANSGLATAVGSLEIAREEYNAAVGHRPGNLVPPSALPRLPGSEDNAKAQAVRLHPAMIKAQHDATVADINVLRAEATMSPTVTLEGGVSMSDNIGSDTFTNSGSIALKGSGPIYRGGELYALKRQALARRDASRSNLHVIRHGVEQQVGAAYAALEIANASRQASERQIRAATVAFRGVREEATLGARTTLDVLNAEQELLDAQAGLISAGSDEFIRAYSVLAAVGQLTAEHLNLGVPRYDPTEYYNLVKSAPSKRSKQGKQLDRVLEALGKQ